MENKDKGDEIEESLLNMLLVILLEGASIEVLWLLTPSSRNCRRKGKWRKRKGSREKDDEKFICQCFFFYRLWCHFTGTKG